MERQGRPQEMQQRTTESLQHFVDDIWESDEDEMNDSIEG